MENTLSCNRYSGLSRNRFLAEVVKGLSKPQKELPPKYFYDERGAILYEKICNLDEYYIPRTEAAIMERNINDIVERLGANLLLIEYGCGNCSKTRFLLKHLNNPIAYIPIDISREQLLRVSESLTLDYPSLEVFPVCADFTGDFELPVPHRSGERISVYFPGSTIGNFEPTPARQFLRHIADVCGPEGSLLIGVDLKKDATLLHNAYNDPKGITAAFNLNLLERINRELGGDFNVESFRHNAYYHAEKDRVEMHLISQRDQIVHLDGTTITFTEGESIWTESSYKYDVNEFADIADSAGFTVDKVWTDERQWFSVQHLVVK